MTLDELVALGGLEVFPDHFRDKLLQGHARHPAELRPGLAGIAQQGFHLGGAEVARIDRHDAVPVAIVALLVDPAAAPLYADAELLGRKLDELAYRILLAG